MELILMCIQGHKPNHNKAVVPTTLPSTLRKQRGAIWIYPTRIVFVARMRSKVPQLIQWAVVAFCGALLEWLRDDI